MKRRIISLFVCIVMVLTLLPAAALAASEDLYVVAGVEGLCGSNWDGTDATNAMTENAGVYTKVFPAVAVGEYQFKVVKNSSGGQEWIGDATGNNVTFAVTQACDVTVTYETATGAITVSGDGVSMVTELQVDEVYAVGNGDGAWLGDVKWDPAAEKNKMTEVREGVYQITYSNVECFDNYQVKFAANGSWVDNWGYADYTAIPGPGTYGAAYNGQNIIVNVTPELADVTLTLDLTGFNYATKTGAAFTVEITEAAAPVENVAIDEVNFPDEVFRDYVRSHFDQDGNGLLSAGEASAVERIPEGDDTSEGLTGLNSLKGIEYFGNLRVLNCSIGTLTELDVSKNPLLEQLFCNRNWLTALDVSNNPALWELECEYNNISSLDLSHSANLTALKTTGNPLSQLDLSQNPELWKMDIGGDNLTTLDISSNAKLRYLVISNSKLTHVDTTNNTALGYVILDGTQMTSFDWSMSTDTSPYLAIYNNAYSVAVDAEGRFDLSTLPGSFDVTRASGWAGGTVEGNILTADPGAAEVTYSYDVGKGYSGQFKLVLEGNRPALIEVTSITATGIIAPVVGEEARFEVAVSEDGVLAELVWAELDNAPASVDDIYNANPIYNAFTFQPGKVYVAAVAVGADMDYTLSADITSTVNGQSATFVDIYEPKYGYVFYVFEALPDTPQGTPIEVARVVEVTLPQIGQTASYEYRIVEGEGCVKFTSFDNDSAAWVVTDTAPASYQDVDNGQWHYASDGEALVFEEGKYYTFVAWLDADEGRYISETAVAFVNGIPAKLNVYSYYEFDVWATFTCEEPVELITQVTLDGSKLNIGDGKAPGSMVVAETENYIVYLEELAQESGEAVTKFEGGKLYAYGVCLKAKEGYAFAEDAAVTVTGVQWQEITANEYVPTDAPNYVDEVRGGWVFIATFEVEPADPTNPSTGDSANLVLWFGLMAASAMAILVIGKKRNFVK